MSDFDRGRYHGKKKFHPANEHPSSFGRSFFGNRSTFGSSKYDKESATRPDSPAKMKQPKLLIKAREPTEDVSPSRAAVAGGGKEQHDNVSSSVGNSSGAAAAANNDSAATLAPSKMMTESVKLLEDSVCFPENVQDFLRENSEFMVVGVVGSQGVGKSSILNLLAHSHVTEELKRTVFKNSTGSSNNISTTDYDVDEYGGAGDCVQTLTDNLSKVLNIQNNNNNNKATKTTTGMMGTKNEIFKIQSIDNIANNSHSTDGIDLFITSNRVILLDCQPFLSVSVLDDLVQNESKRSNIVSEFIPLENSGEIYGLQLTAFLMSVCHVLIVVQDWFFDSNVIRFIQTAEMLKPTNSNPEDDFTDHFPHLLLIQNRAQMVDFQPFQFKKIQRIYRKLFNKSKLNFESSLGLGTGRLISCLSTENCGNPINLFLIPDYDVNSNNIFSGHPPLEELVKKLRSNILGATKYPLTHVQLTEKTWLNYCSKVWDNVKKSSFFVEYTKLMP